MRKYLDANIIENTKDINRLKKEHPEIVAKFMKTTTSRVLKIM